MAFLPADQEHFLELWRAIFPGSYTDPVETEGQSEGQDIPAFMARLWELVSAATNGTAQSYYLRAHSTQTGSISQGATFASGFLEATYAPPILGPITLHAGQLLVAFASSTDGTDADLARYRVMSDVVLTGGTQAVPVIAELPGSDWNLEAAPAGPFPGHPDSDGPTPWPRWRIEGSGQDTLTANVTTVSTVSAALQVGALFRFVGLDPFEDGRPREVTASGAGSSVFTPPVSVLGTGVTLDVVPSAESFGITLEQVTDIGGGSGATLDAIGSDRGIGRVAGETDEAYRARIGSFQDIISPAAIECILVNTLGPCDIPWVLLESCVGAPSGTPCLMGFTWDLHPYDFGDLNSVSVSGSVLGATNAVYDGGQSRFFLIVVGCSPANPPFGLSYNDGPYPNAYDFDQPYDDPEAGLDNPDYLTCIGRAWSAVNAARAAGVSFAIVQNCDL